VLFHQCLAVQESTDSLCVIQIELILSLDLNKPSDMDLHAEKMLAGSKREKRLLINFRK